MTKRCFEAAFALIFSIMLFCSCSAARLSLDEYRSETEAAVTGWFGAISDWAGFVGKYVMVNGEDMSFEETQKNKGGLEQKLLKVEDALDKIDKIGDPPEEYDELHRKLKNGVSKEREWVKLQREMNNAKSEAEYSAAGDKIEKLVSGDDTLPMVYLELVKKWKAAESAVSQ